MNLSFEYRTSFVLSSYLKWNPKWMKNKAIYILSYGILNYKNLISVLVTFFRIGKVLQPLKNFPLRHFLLERNSLIIPLRHIWVETWELFVTFLFYYCQELTFIQTNCIIRIVSFFLVSTVLISSLCSISKLERTHFIEIWF